MLYYKVFSHSPYLFKYLEDLCMSNENTTSTAGATGNTESTTVVADTVNASGATGQTGATNTAVNNSGATGATSANDAASNVSVAKAETVTASPKTTVASPAAMTAAPIVEDNSLSAVTDQADIILGKNICPNDPTANTSLENALATLRSTAITTPSSIATAQTTLYNVISRYLVRSNEADCFVFLTNILFYINANMDLSFTPKLRFRATNLLTKLNTAQHKEFIVLLSILIDTAPIQTRTAIANSMNWDVIRKEFIPTTSDISVGRLLKFFQIK